MGRSATLALALLFWLGDLVLVGTGPTEQQTCPNGDFCPEYRNRPEDRFCCPSALHQGDSFCCDYEEFMRQKYTLKEDLLRNAPKVVGVAVALLLILVASVVLGCFFCSCCLLYKFRQRRREVYRGCSTTSQVVYPTSCTAGRTGRSTPFLSEAKFIEGDPPPYPTAQHFPTGPSALLHVYSDPLPGKRMPNETVEAKSV